MTARKTKAKPKPSAIDVAVKDGLPVEVHQRNGDPHQIVPTKVHHVLPSAVRFGLAIPREHLKAVGVQVERVIHVRPVLDVPNLERTLPANKIHALNLDLHQARSFDAIEQLISHHLPENFDLSDTCLRVWAEPLDPANQSNLVFSEIVDDTKTWLAALPQAYCGAPPAIVTDDWFLEPAASVAIIPLTIGYSTKQLIGFLALASDSKNRFYEEMGADFLNNIGELISAALTRHIELS